MYGFCAPFYIKEMRDAIYAHFVGGTYSELGEDVSLVSLYSPYRFSYDLRDLFVCPPVAVELCHFPFGLR